MSVAAGKGGARRPSPLRRLFASLRRQPIEPPAVTPATPPPAEPSPPPQLLAGPEAGSRPRQTSLLEPPSGPHGDRVIAMRDFVARFQRLMAKQGIGARDPLAPVLDMLCEMLLHFTHLAEDQAADLDGHAHRLVAEFRTASAQARGLLAEEARSIDRAMVRSAERIEAAAAETGRQRGDVLAGFARDTEELFRRTVIQQTRVRVWTDRAIIAVFVAALAGTAFWFGQTQARDEMTVAIQATEPRLVAAVLRDGPKVALHWLDLIEWNRLDAAPRDCAPQPSGQDYRKACSFTFWDGPPEDLPPRQP